MICESPKIAVCIVGQMRTLKRTKVAEQIYQIWKRVGTNCVDIYMDVGIEATNNKLKYSNISITAGASAPESKVIEIANSLKQHLDANIKEHGQDNENIYFKMPPELR